MDPTVAIPGHSSPWKNSQVLLLQKPIKGIYK